MLNVFCVQNCLIENPALKERWTILFREYGKEERYVIHSPNRGRKKHEARWESHIKGWGILPLLRLRYP
jgi:hypothetical protein